MFGRAGSCVGLLVKELPLSCIIVDFCMEGCKERSLHETILRPLHWFHYVDDTFMIWW
jgi:hypothetical protein